MVDIDPVLGFHMGWGSARLGVLLVLLVVSSGCATDLEEHAETPTLDTGQNQTYDIGESFHRSSSDTTTYMVRNATIREKIPTGLSPINPRNHTFISVHLEIQSEDGCANMFRKNFHVVSVGGEVVPVDWPTMARMHSLTMPMGRCDEDEENVGGAEESGTVVFDAPKGMKDIHLRVYDRYVDLQLST